MPNYYPYAPTPVPPAPGVGTSTPVYNGPVYQSTPQQSNPGIVWVTGEDQARSFPIVPGNSLLLMDMNNLTLYSKSSDSTGRITLEIYDLHKREEPKLESTDFIRREELESVVSSAVAKAMSSFQRPQYNKHDRPVRKEVKKDE